MREKDRSQEKRTRKAAGPVLISPPDQSYDCEVDRSPDVKEKKKRLLSLHLLFTGDGMAETKPWTKL